jgi:hypothetical protein
MERLLRASIDREVDKKYIAKLERDNEKLRRAIGLMRLERDIRLDVREAAAERLARAGGASMFHKPQAE